MVDIVQRLSSQPGTAKFDAKDRKILALLRGRSYACF